MKLLRQVLFSLCIIISAHSQHFNYYVYNDNHGMLNNSIKTVIQDKEGFIWIGTDGGLVHYDGKSFLSNNKSLPSTYIKNLYVRKNKRLIAVTDLGIGYINRTATSFSYESILGGSSLLNDTGLVYPKTIFEDASGVLWIGDQSGIIRIDDRGARKFFFEEEYRPDSYFRSFLFIEDSNHNLIVSSWKGSLFIFNKQSMKFELLPITFGSGFHSIDDMKSNGNNSILLATNTGLIEVTYTEDLKNFSTKTIVALPEIASFEWYKKDFIILTTWNNGTYYYNINSRKLQKFSTAVPRNTSKVLVDREQCIWICTNEGLVLIKEPPFTPALINSQITLSSNYIRNLISDEQGTVYFSDQEYIFKIRDSLGSYTYQRLHSSLGKRIYTFGVRDNSLWVSYRNGDFFYNNGKKTLSLLAKETNGRFTSLKVDAHGNCLGIVERINKIFVLKSNDSYSFIDIPIASHQAQKLGLTRKSEVVYIYVDSLLHLYRIDAVENKLYKLQLKNNVKFPLGTIINDFTSARNDEFLVSTNFGLYKIQNDKVLEVMRSEEKNSNNFSSVASDATGGLWIGTGNRLIYLKNGNEIQFTQQDGIPNSTISPAGLVVDNNNRLWTATSGGLAYLTSSSMEVRKTRTPVFVQFTVDQIADYIGKEVKDIYGSKDIEIAFASLTYPSRTEYQYRIKDLRNNWQDLTEGKISFLKIPFGEYIVEVRARQAGYTWSDVAQLHFIVHPRWFETWWMNLIYISILALIIVILYKRQHRQRLLRTEVEKLKLKSLVLEKTKELQNKNDRIESLLSMANSAKDELQKSNEALRKANILKSDLLGIAAHDLKNPLSTIISYSQVIEELAVDNQELIRYSKIIFTSGMNMLRIITELLDSTMLENSDLKLNFTTVNVTDLCKTIISNNKARADLKGQEIITELEEHVITLADNHWIREAIDNIISNAIKFSPYNSTIRIGVTNHDEKVKIAIQDEGPGITENDKKNLFLKFTKLSAKPTGGESSTGLGLSIVKEIIRLHKGEILVESVVGRGTVFTLILNQVS